MKDTFWLATCTGVPLANARDLHWGSTRQRRGDRNWSSTRQRPGDPVLRAVWTAVNTPVRHATFDAVSFHRARDGNGRLFGIADAGDRGGVSSVSCV